MIVPSWGLDKGQRSPVLLLLEADLGPLKKIFLW